MKSCGSEESPFSDLRSQGRAAGPVEPSRTASRLDLFERRRRALATVHATGSNADPAFRPAMEDLRAVEAEAEQSAAL
ncbi:hypothetical protein ACFWP3_36890 [Streptomyces sp. NPDC058525]|uniref:hypothetical protein n=1 Tax=unclassified Streptomyces TaxID=2593676 RepID=UPI003663C3B3